LYFAATVMSIFIYIFVHKRADANSNIHRFLNKNTETKLLNTDLATPNTHTYTQRMHTTTNDGTIL